VGLESRNWDLKFSLGLLKLVQTSEPTGQHPIMVSEMDRKPVDGGKHSPKGQVEILSWPDPLSQRIPTEMLHEVSEAEKEILFRQFMPVQAAQKARGQALLQKLSELAPSAALRCDSYDAS